MPSRTGVLLIQLGTPDAPTPPALRRYLRQFLGDPRVIESPFVRNVIVPLFVLPVRPARSAAKYRRICWTRNLLHPPRFSLQDAEIGEHRAWTPPIPPRTT